MDEDECPECGSTDVSISEVYELGLTLFCYTCKQSFSVEEEDEEEE